MDVQQQVDDYIADQPEPKRADLQELHRRIRTISPGCRMWFLDGRNEQNKVVSNPNIGYGQSDIKYANGDTKEFYRIGLSANTTGISVYVMGAEDKQYLANTYGARLGKAKVTGYCVKFRSIGDIDMDVFDQMIRSSFAAGEAQKPL